MRRMIVIRNLLESLRIFFESGIAPSTASYYGILHLAQFTDAYDGLMGRLTARQKRRALCVTDLISSVAVHKKALKDMRNNWMAHLQDDGGFAEDASGFIGRVGMPGDSAAHYEMHVCVIAFVDTVRAMLPEIAEPGAAHAGAVAPARERPKARAPGTPQSAHPCRRRPPLAPPPPPLPPRRPGRRCRL